MVQMVFINLPVADLKASIDFYAAIGAINVPHFTDDSTAMMSFSDAVNVMLLTHDKWRQFTTKAIPDARTHAQVLLALSRDSRAAVDSITADAAKAGAVCDPTPGQDYGWMYGRSFEDPDGHIWEVSWMDVDAAIASTAEPKNVFANHQPQAEGAAA